MKELANLIKDISVAAIIISVIIFVLPNSSNGKTAKSICVFILVVFVIISVSNSNVDFDVVSDETTLTYSIELIEDATVVGIKTQLSAILSAENIEYSKIDVETEIKDQKINVISISVWSSSEYEDKILTIIKSDFNINGVVYESEQ